MDSHSPTAGRQAIRVLVGALIVGAVVTWATVAAGARFVDAALVAGAVVAGLGTAAGSYAAFLAATASRDAADASRATAEHAREALARILKPDLRLYLRRDLQTKEIHGEAMSNENDGLAFVVEWYLRGAVVPIRDERARLQGWHDYLPAGVSIYVVTPLGVDERPTTEVVERAVVWVWDVRRIAQWRLTFVFTEPNKIYTDGDAMGVKTDEQISEWGQV